MNAVHTAAPLQVDLQIAADKPDVPDGADWEVWVGAALSAAGRTAGPPVGRRPLGGQVSRANARPAMWLQSP